MAKQQKEATLAPREAPRETPKPESPKPDEVYSFPSKSRCPRCKSTQTDRLAARGAIQYRRCRAPVCRHRYRVLGVKV